MSHSVAARDIIQAGEFDAIEQYLSIGGLPAARCDRTGGVRRFDFQRTDLGGCLIGHMFALGRICDMEALVGSRVVFSLDRETAMLRRDSPRLPGWRVKIN